MRSPTDASVTLLIVNDAQQPWTARVAMDGSVKNLVLLRSMADTDPSKVITQQPLHSRNNTTELILEPFSLTILTDKPLLPDGPGRF